jgi:hypothetical protein
VAPAGAWSTPSSRPWGPISTRCVLWTLVCDRLERGGRVAIRASLRGAFHASGLRNNHLTCRARAWPASLPCRWSGCLFTRAPLFCGQCGPRGHPAWARWPAGGWGQRGGPWVLGHRGRVVVVMAVGDEAGRGGQPKRQPKRPPSPGQVRGRDRARSGTASPLKQTVTAIVSGLSLQVALPCPTPAPSWGDVLRALACRVLRVVSPPPVSAPGKDRLRCQAASPRGVAWTRGPARSRA